MTKRGSNTSSKIRHTEILDQTGLPAGLINRYLERVVPVQTRTIRLLGRKSSARILNTLLGYEVQASYKRIQCPDLATARYLRLFSELGCHSIKLPYDPTLTAQLIPGFEAAIEDARDRVRDLFPFDPNTQRYVLRRLFEIVRRRLTAK